MTTQRTTRSRLSSPWPPVLAAALALVLVACGAATPSGSAPSQPSPIPGTASPSPTPASPTPQPPDPAIRRDSIARVVTDDLRVRSKPEVSDSSALLTPLLDTDRLVYVVDGPVAGSGYAWYLVAPFPATMEDVFPLGWVAAADRTGEPWLAADFSCPSMPTTYTAFVAIHSLIALACFGDQDISFPAKVMRPEATCGIDPGWAIVPAWLGGVCPQPEFVMFDPARPAVDSYTYTAPDFDSSGIDAGVVPEEAADVVVTGRHDHPESATCHVEATEGGTPLDVSPQEVVLICRSHFVVTAIVPAAS